MATYYKNIDEQLLCSLKSIQWYTSYVISLSERKILVMIFWKNYGLIEINSLVTYNFQINS